MPEYYLVELKNIDKVDLREAIENPDLMSISNVTRLQSLKAGLFMYLCSDGETDSIVLQNDDFRCLKQNGWTIIYYGRNDSSYVIYDLELSCMSKNKSIIREFNICNIIDAKI